MKGPHCPQCGTPFVRVTHHQGRLEPLLRWFSVYPFRCQVCTNRFVARRRGIKDATQSFDRREYKRLPTNFPAVFAANQLSLDEVVTDLSMGGCSVRTTQPLARGTFVELLLKPSTREPGIKVETAIVCCVRPSTVGVKFLEVEPQEKTRLSRVVHSLLLSQTAAP